MLGKTVLTSLLALLLAGYFVVPLMSVRARRRREARALRRFVLRDVRAGRQERTDATVLQVLTWCEEVVETGRELPLLVGSRYADVHDREKSPDE
jgi:hypothetical protein